MTAPASTPDPVPDRPPLSPADAAGPGADAALGTLLSVPPPVLATERLLDHLQSGWGLSGTLSPLTSERDLNHRLTGPGGRWLVKLTNPAEPEAMTDFQTRAFLHVAARDAAVPVSRLVPVRDGAPWLDLPEGRLRVFGWLDGLPLHQVPRSAALAGATGAALARLTLALSDFDHPAADHVLLWDIKQLPRLAPLLPAIADPGLRAMAETFVAGFARDVAPALAGMPAQICHADFNPHNLLADPGDQERIAGILDFGDMVRTPRICDLAVAASYQIDPDRPVEGLSAFLAGYGRHVPVTADETALLFDLVTARLVTTLAIAGWRAARQPGNAAYILRNTASARAGLEAFRHTGRGAATRCFADALGTPT